MNLLHFKYAVEVAKTKSISQAAENLYMGQPNLSRAIKELEEKIGIVIFSRTSKGITITEEGEEFLQYARKIVAQVEEVERVYQKTGEKKQSFSVWVPDEEYISYALAEFAAHMNKDENIDINYRETGAMEAVLALLNEECNLAIISYCAEAEDYFKELFAEKKIVSEDIAQLRQVLLISKEHALAKNEEIFAEELRGFTEIMACDTNLSAPLAIKAKRKETLAADTKRICVNERADRLTLLEKVPGTFMWSIPVSKDICNKYGLIVRSCADGGKIYKNAVIYRKGYHFTKEENLFVIKVKETVGRMFG